MFKKRVIENPQPKKDDETQDVKPPTFTDVQIRTYKEQAIRVLNILDSKGINIYDPDHCPETFFKRYTGKVTDRQIQKIISVTNKEKPVEKQQDNADNLSVGLMAVLMQNKNS